MSSFRNIPFQRPSTSFSTRQKQSSSQSFRINKLELVGFAGDPVFQRYKQITSQINQQNKNNLQILISEQKHQADYDIKTLSMKRNSYSFLPALKEEKNSQNNQRPPYFLIDRKTPVFKLTDLQKAMKSSSLLKVGSNLQFEDKFRKMPPREYQLQMQNYFKSSYQETQDKSYAYFILQSDTLQQFRIIFELYKNIVPKACENFLTLCMGYKNSSQQTISYKHTILHRIIKNGYIQGGRLPANESIYGGYFEDECFQLSHDIPGILGMVNQGQHHTNACQFYITLEKLKAFDTKCVAFGRVVEGLKYLSKINKLQDNSQVPFERIQIIRCGKLDQELYQNLQFNKETTLSVISQGKKNQDNLKIVLAREPTLEDVDSYNDDIYEDLTQRVFKLQPQTLLPEEKCTHLDHLSKYSEKFNLGNDFLNLMKSLETSYIAMAKILENPYQFETFDQLLQQVKNVFEMNIIESKTCAILYCIKSKSLIKIPSANSGRFILAYNILDINSLMDVTNCGSTFLIMKKISSQYKPPSANDFLQSGEKIDAAGYCYFGPQIQMVYHAGFRVNMYTYSEKAKQFLLTYNKIKASNNVGVMHANLSLYGNYSKNVTTFINRKVKNDPPTNIYRYNSSFISNFHSTLLFGGVILYPDTSLQEPEQLLSIFDALALSFISSKAQQRSSCGESGEIVQKTPKNIQQRIQLFVGADQEIQELENLFLQIRRQTSILQQLNESKYQ